MHTPKPSAWLVSIRGIDDPVTMYRRVVVKESEALACKKQWPEQMPYYWDEKLKFKYEIIITPLFIRNDVLEEVAVMLDAAEYYQQWGQYENEAVAQQTSHEAAKAVRKMKS